MQLGLLFCEQSPLHTRVHIHILANVIKQLHYIYLPHFSSVIPAVSMSSSDDLTVDGIIGKPLLVAPSLGGQVTLFGVVTAVPCPSIQWMVNGSAVSNGANYVIGNPCSSSPAGSPHRPPQQFFLAVPLQSFCYQRDLDTFLQVASKLGVPVAMEKV